jgi:hypothetical protein
MRINPSFAAVTVCAALSTPLLAADPYVPVEWKKFVKVDGQPLPVPEQWLADEEARIAHSLKLPDSVPKPQSFDFDKAWWKSWWPGNGKVNVQYFNHLCASEAGEWVFRTVPNVEGLYFARPSGFPSDDFLKDPYGPEAPWVQRRYQIAGGSLNDDGQQFVGPPSANYRFVEEPRRKVEWQKWITEPYVRMYGYTREPALDQNGQPTTLLKEKTPMQIIGIPKPSARYGYTWRGIRRERDRELGVAGGELLIYDMQTKEVLGVRRTFQVTGRKIPVGPGEARWLLTQTCPNALDELRFNTIGEFAARVLLTIEPSTFGRKQ